MKRIVSLVSLAWLIVLVVWQLPLFAAGYISPEVLRGPTCSPPVAVGAETAEAARTAGGQRCVVIGTRSESGGSYLRETEAKTPISPLADEALQVVPEWLQMDLYDMFLRMTESMQDDYGEMILGLQDPRTIDEVAFTVAHSSRNVLKGTDPAVYAKNAELLYRIDPEIPYADIVDHGEPGVDTDFYSTVRYWTIRDGKRSSYELPPEIYYWYVVHPKLGDENPSMSPNLSQQTSTYGYFWREYLFYNPSEEYDYTVYFLTKTPNWIDDTELDGWGPTATGYLVDGTKTCRAGIVYFAGDPGKPCLEEHPYTLTRVIVTTLEVERGYRAGHTKMLENLVMRSSGFPADLLVPRGAQGSDFVAILDDTGDPDIVGPIEEVLDRNNINYEIHTSDELRLPIWTQFTKIIVASHQPRSCYEALAEEHAVGRLQDWMKRMAGTFEFHGACDPEDSWADLDLPFGLGYVAEATDDVTIGRYPLLKDVIKNASYLWDDSQVDVSLPAWRPFEPDSMAVDVIGNWVSRILPFRARGNRPIQPNQICFEHNGNCGEIQDLMNAASRTCLIPCAGVNNWAWDHVSNEFWEQDWHGFQVDWNGNHTSVAKQSILYDKDYGGSKDLSAILQDRGDTFPINATARFSKVCRFHVRVEDFQGNPVDGAQIRAYVHFYNDPGYGLVCPIWAYTDSTGEVVMQLGNNRDFWFTVSSEVGDAPLKKVLTSTKDDFDYHHVWHMEGVMPHLPDITRVDFPPSAEKHYKLAISFNVDYEMLYSPGRLTFGTKEDAGNVDFFIVDSEQFEKYERGEPFSAYQWREDSPGDDFEVEIPDEEVYYLVFSNEDTTVVKEFTTVNIDVFKRESGAWVPVQSFSNFVGIPSRHSYVLMFNNTQPPHIYAAGFVQAEVNSSTGFTFGMKAFVLDPNGPSDVKDVEVCYGGIPLGMHLRDDGKGADAVAGDSIFSYGEGIPAGRVTPGLYRLELIATDTAGNKSSAWPFLNVLSAPLGLPSYRSQMNPRLWQPAATANGAPVILGGGFFGRETVQPGDLVKMVVFVDDPDGLSDIDKVELFLEGGIATGLYFNDEGRDGDEKAGDGVYTFQTFVPPGLSTGYLTLEVAAFDKSGNVSAVFPYLTVN